MQCYTWHGWEGPDSKTEAASPDHHVLSLSISQAGPDSKNGSCVTRSPRAHTFYKPGGSR